MKVISNSKRLKIIELFAKQAHKAQVDKAGEPYIGHLLRVASNCSSTSAKIVALLHDIVEDGQSTHDELRELGILRSEELHAIKLLDKTVIYDLEEIVSQENYYRRIKGNKLAREVKLADLRDNMNLSRFIRNGIELTQKHHQRIKVYEVRLNFLLDD